MTSSFWWMRRCLSMCSLRGGWKSKGARESSTASTHAALPTMASTISSIDRMLCAPSTCSTCKLPLMYDLLFVSAFQKHPRVRTRRSSCSASGYPTAEKGRSCWMSLCVLGERCTRRALYSLSSPSLSKPRFTSLGIMLPLARTTRAILAFSYVFAFVSGSRTRARVSNFSPDFSKLRALRRRRSATCRMTCAGMNFLVARRFLRFMSSFAFMRSRSPLRVSFLSSLSARSSSTDLRCVRIVSLTRSPGSHLGGRFPIVCFAEFDGHGQ
mmetsp:Transcript_25845/g.79773  ORF Transcript_25845/g.79773 Transcript_25845/m.79773 type:complete len:269 (-) Transcript_25845:16-822(-)